jgi:hypothetical protein
MAKKQTRRSISVSRVTNERLKSFCEANNVSMSQFVESRVGDFLGEGTVSIPAPRPSTPRPTLPSAPLPPKQSTQAIAQPPRPAAPPVPMTAASARFAVEPPPPIIKKVDHESPAPAPIAKTADQIFTF